jgi:enamine deaminase RidA (YjgF/YER057c/UK114 family)
LNSFRYSVDIETWGRPPSDDQVDAFIDALSSLGAPRSTIGHGGLAGGIGVTFSIDVRGVKGSKPVTEATRRAVETFEAACEQVGIVYDGIARVDVMTDPYLERWITQEPERYAGVSEVADLLGVSRQRVAQLRTKRGFPAPIAELRAGPIWDVSSLGLFLEEWERRPGRPRGAKSA